MDTTFRQLRVTYVHSHYDTVIDSLLYVTGNTNSFNGDEFYNPKHFRIYSLHWFLITEHVFYSYMGLKFIHTLYTYI